jgi:hypothetical protein
MKKMKVTKYQSLSPFSGEYHFFIFYFPTFLPFYLENIDWLFASFCKSFFEELSYHFSYFYMHIKSSTLYKTIYYYEYKSAIYLMPSLKGNNSPFFLLAASVASAVFIIRHVKKTIRSKEQLFKINEYLE